MYQKLLDKIASEMSSQKLQLPCSKKSMDLLKKKTLRALDHELPDGYERFLAITNGLVWNGLTIYASETAPVNGIPRAQVLGFVEANEGYRSDREEDGMDDYLIFGEDSTALYTYHIPDDDFKVIELVGMDELESYSTFDKLVREALRSCV